MEVPPEVLIPRCFCLSLAAQTPCIGKFYSLAVFKFSSLAVFAYPWLHRLHSSSSSCPSLSLPISDCTDSIHWQVLLSHCLCLSLTAQTPYTGKFSSLTVFAYLWLHRLHTLVSSPLSLSLPIPDCTDSMHL